MIVGQAVAQALGYREDPLGIGRQAYEAIVGGVATVLRNQPRDEVATETSLSGSLEDPNADMLKAVGGIIRNSFFQAVLPGLEHRRSAGRRSRGAAAARHGAAPPRRRRGRHAGGVAVEVQGQFPSRLSCP